MMMQYGVSIVFSRCIMIGYHTISTQHWQELIGGSHETIIYFTLTYKNGVCTVED